MGDRPGTTHRGYPLRDEATERFPPPPPPVVPTEPAGPADEEKDGTVVAEQPSGGGTASHGSAVTICVGRYSG